MKKLLPFVLFIVLLSVVSCSQNQKEILTKDKKNAIVEKYNNLLAASTDIRQFPRTITDKGELVNTEVYDWTSGFFAGNLWYLYELTGDGKWKDAAMRWTEAMDTVQYWSGGHDVGFMINCSFGNAIKFAGREDYRKVIVQAAESLCKRYNPAVKSIESWDYRMAWDNKTEWFYPVIIDNLMNLELLFEASLISGNDKYRQIALQHAQTTMKNHYRDDFSSFHVVDYDTITGAVLDKATCQGFTDGSSWSRGQSWGLYGVITCYRYTKDPEYLRFAENIADFLISNPKLPEDGIPYWDYNVNDPGLTPEWDYNASDYPEILRDASAGAIMCSALFELSTLSTRGESYREAATHILKSLSSPTYFNTPDDKYFIINHCVGSLPHRAEVDKPLVYADYYFLESLYRYKKLQESGTIQ